MERLPLEITLEILFRVQDLDTLSSLLRASPNAFRTFDIDPSAITETALENDTSYSHIKDIIRMIILIRAGKFPITSIGDLQQRVTSVAMINERHSHGPVAMFKQPVCPRTTTQVLISVLTTSRRLLCLTWNLLDFYLERFRRIKPCTATVPDRWDMMSAGSSLQPILRILETSGQRLEVNDAGPPSWVEEQLVLRGFWRIQLIYDLRRAIRNGIGPSWSELEAFKLSDFSIAEIYDFKDTTEVNKNIGAGFDRLYLDPSETVEQGIILSILDYLAEEDHQPDTFGETIIRPSLELDAGESFVNRLSETVDDYASVFLDYDDHQNVPFDVYRRLGMSIWTRERLVGYGFHDEDPVVWLSILSQEDIMALMKGWEERCSTSGPSYITGRIDFLFKGEVVEHVNPLIRYYTGRQSRSGSPD